MCDTVAAAAPLLAQQGLVELLELVKDADSVERKLSVDASRQRSAVEADAMTTGFVCSGSFKGIAQEAIRASRERCAPSEAFQVAAETRAFLGERGIAPAENQQTKTRKALSFFSDQLKEASDAV
jgi:glutaminase